MSEEINRKIRLLAGRCYVVLLEPDQAGTAQIAQISKEGGAPINGVEYFEPVGFSSRPPAGEGVEGLVVCRAGDTEQAMLVCVGARKYRIPLEDGESAIFNTPHGDFVKIKADRDIHVKAAGNVLVESPTAEFTGNVLVRGNLTVEGDTTLSSSVTSNGVNISGDHTHNSNGSGNQTDVPQ